MYVCVCNEVTDHQIRHAVSNGVHTVDALCSELNIATCCGKCKGCARKVLRKSLESGKIALAGQNRFPSAVAVAAI